ncbi:uncharacterized protein [Panulirus ornatus]|uniref:uncharacterized protein isoform X13 n=1 Tax=Panulirus ornatus TaxID=150431 RepID=UPI003A88BFE1
MNKLVRITIITLILGLSLLAVIFTANWLLLAEQERLSSLLQARHKDSYSVSIPLLGTFIPKPLELPRVPNPDVNALFVLPQTLKDVLALRKMVYQPEALTFVDRLKVFLYHCSLSLLVVPVVVLVVLGILILGLCILYRYKNILTGLWRRLKGLLLRGLCILRENVFRRRTEQAQCVHKNFLSGLWRRPQLSSRIIRYILVACTVGFMLFLVLPHNTLAFRVDEFYLMVVYIIVELCPEAPDTSEDSTETVVDSPEDNAPEVKDTPDDAPEVVDTPDDAPEVVDTPEDDSSEVEDTSDDAPEVEDTPEDDAPEVVEDTPEDDAPEVVEDTPEDDAPEAVEDTPDDAPEVVEDTPEVNASEVVEDTPEVNASEVVEDTPEDDASEVVEDTPEDDASVVVEDTPEDDASVVVEDTAEDDAPEVVEDTAEDDAPEVVEDTPEDDAPEVVKDTQEDDAPEVVEDTPEDDASVVVEDTPEDDTSVQSGRSNRKTPAQSSKKTRSRRKKIRPRRKKSTPAQGSGDRDSPVRESGKNRTPAKDSNTREAGNNNFRRDRRWLEFLEMPTEEREFVQKETPSIEDEFGIKIKFPKRRNYIILQGGRQAVSQACLKLQRLVDLSQPSGVDLLAEVNNTSYRVRPNRIWPCGNVLRKVNVDPSLHGVLIGRSGQTVQGIRNKYCVDIYVPGKSEEYKTIDIVGQSKDVQAAKKEVLRLIRQSTRRSSRMYGNFLRRSTQSYERTSRRRGPKAVSGDVAEEVKSEVVTDDVAEEVESEVVTDDVAEEVKSEVVTDDVAEEVKSEVVTDDVAEEVESEVVTDDVAEEVKSEVVTDDVAEEVKSEVVTHDVAEEVKSEVVTHDVPEKVKSEVVTHDVAEEVKSEVVTHDVAEEVKSEVVASGDDWREDTEGFWRVD